MPAKTVTRPCLRCGAAAAITWNQTFAMGSDYPGREDVVGFDCPSGCEVPFREVEQAYPTARTQPARRAAADFDSASPGLPTAPVLMSDNRKVSDLSYGVGVSEACPRRSRSGRASGRPRS